MSFADHLSTVCDGYEKLNYLFLAPGTPEPTATWLQNGKPLHLSDDLKQSFNGRTAKLFFREVYPEDDGCYVCTAVNSEGEVSTTAKLKVKGSCPVLVSILLDCAFSGKTAKNSAQNPLCCRLINDT